jgi:hypothetical protein
MADRKTARRFRCNLSTHSSDVQWADKDTRHQYAPILFMVYV